jgi:hypothetical protein
MDKALITDVFGLPAEDVWKTIFSHLWQYFSQRSNPQNSKKNKVFKYFFG